MEKLTANKLSFILSFFVVKDMIRLASFKKPMTNIMYARHLVLLIESSSGIILHGLHLQTLPVTMFCFLGPRFIHLGEGDLKVHLTITQTFWSVLQSLCF